jgi:peptide/nickel transport system substrate-binding protein
MLRKRLVLIFGVLVVASMLLAACGPKAASAVPERRNGKGGYLDEIVFSLVDGGSAITQLQAGAIDIYASGLSSADLPAIQAAGLNYSNQNGLFYELTFNPVGPTFPGTGKLNPFSSPKVREAMNWLVDRDYINQEVYAGGGLVKFFPITTQFPDYADLADVARALEAKYAYNPDKANEVISAEMTTMGATKGTDGKWMFNGEPVTLIFLIRTDSDGTRKPIGDYVANQLESIGFTVDRQYKTSSEASPLWVLGNPADGLWNMYTGAWSATIIDRDQGDNFQFYFDPSSAYGFSPLWQAYTPVPEFHDLCLALAYNSFTSLADRRVAFARALELSLEDSERVWLIDGKNYAPFNTNVAVTYDLAAGIDGAQIWPYTLRFTDQEGGTMKWGQPDLFVDPWNPVSGSNWAFDASAERATYSGAVMFDPHTGLVYPLNIDHATVTAQEGLPIGATLDWVTLDFVPQIDVPADAWADWDATTQKFITVGEKYPDGVTSKIKTVVYYPADLYKTVKWHDGSNLSAADFVMNFIMGFDIAKPESAIYDESFASSLEAFQSVFKGLRITDTSPLTIEYYSDAYQLDAELNIGIPTGATLWPNYVYGEAGWDQIAIGNLASAAGELAWSADGADTKQVEWMSFIGGPSLDILKKYLDQAAAENYIPYAPTMSQYITTAEAQQRYINLTGWYERQGHFWVGTGPYYLDKVFLTEKTLTLKNNGWYPDSADRWSSFGEPKIADVVITGPSQVTAGQEAVFNVAVSYLGAPYPQAEIKKVTVLLYNASGDIVSVSEAQAVADGQYTVTLSADQTSQLTAGSAKLEVAVVPLPVSIPTFESIQFVVSK